VIGRELRATAVDQRGVDDVAARGTTPIVRPGAWITKRARSLPINVSPIRPWRRAR